MNNKIRKSFSVLGSILAAVILLLLTPDRSQANIGEQQLSRIHSSIQSLQIPFIANKGQMHTDVAFAARTLDGTLFVTGEGDLVYSFSGTTQGTSGRQQIVLSEQLVNAQVEAVAGLHPSTTQVHYFKGNHADKWLTDARTYTTVSLGDVYRGIELQLKAYGNNVEKLFYIAPGAAPEQIQLEISGADSLQVNNQGQLVLATESGAIAFTRPVAWQDINGVRIPVSAEYKILASAGQRNKYTFTIGSYDSTYTLIIDPLLASTVFGSSSDDTSHAIGLDSQGNVYITGETASTTFPVEGYDSSYNGGDRDVFVSKFSADLTTLLASTFIGGTYTDSSFSLAIDASDTVYITGSTASPDFPATINDTVFNNDTNNSFTDVFVTRLSSDLDTLLASTFIGGVNSDEGFDLGILDGDIYVTGYTSSPDFPTTAMAYDQVHDAHQDIFITRLPATLSTLTASTLLGGLGYDYGNALTFDSQGYLFITGSTTSSDFPSTTGLDPIFGNGAQVMVAKLPSDLSALTAASVISGGGTTDSSRCIAIDSSDNIYISGSTNSSNFPTTSGAYDRIAASFEVFVTKFNNTLNTIMASTFLGGGSWDQGYSLLLDSSNNVYITGYTNTEDFPTSPLGYDKTHNGWDDVFISKLSPDLSSLLASTFLGTNGNDWGYSMIRDSSGNIYVTGVTGRNSNDIPFPTTVGAYNTGWPGLKDVFISRLSPDLSGPSLQFEAANYTISEAESLATITVSRFGGGAGAVSVVYSTSDGSATEDSDYSASSGILNWADGDSSSKTFTVPILQDSEVEGGETVILSLSNPVGIPLASPQTAALNIIDDESPGTLQFSSPFFSVTEDETTATMTVTRSNGSDGVVTVEYATTDDTAVAGADYTAKSGVLTWANGDISSKSITIDISNNSFLDGDKTLQLSLEGPTGSVLIGTFATTILTILDDERAGSLQFSQESFPVTENIGQVLITVSRTGGSDGAVSVEYFTLDDTAIDDSDYSAKSGVLSWAAGDTADKSFFVTIIDSIEIEGEEKVTLTLHNQTGSATLGLYNVANINIVDDDGPVIPDSLQFSMSTYTVSEDNPQATITVTRTGSTALPVSVHYATSNGTAVSGVDYVDSSGTLNWGAYDSANKIFTVAITDDANDEHNETVTLTLSTPTGGAITGATNPATLTILDNDTLVQNGTIQFDVPLYSVWENDGSFDVTVFRVNGSDGAVSANFATSDNTAVVGGDYDEISGTLEWTDGDSSYKTFTIQIIDDTEWEGDELVNLTLSTPAGGAVLGAQSTAQLKIMENDPSTQAGTLQFSASQYIINETAAEITVTVIRNEGSSGFIQVDFATSNGTAVIGGDYDEMSGSLEWEDGDAADKTFVIYILDDSEEEGDETVYLTLSNPIGGAILGIPSSAILTILDDETAHLQPFSWNLFLPAILWEAR